MVVGQSQVFTSTVSGGTPPYSYRWGFAQSPLGALVNAGQAVPTSSSFTFTAPSAGNWYVVSIVGDSLSYTSVGSAQATVGNLITLTISIPQAPATGHDTDGSPREPVSVYVDGVKYQIFSNVPATVHLNSAVSHTLQADRSFMKEEWKPGYYYIYTFMQWSDGVTSNPRSFTASGDTAISVFYLRSKYAIL